ncbi:Soluble lytic murein transglycosylase precursor [Lactiplantibacillus plantarum]|uniref:Ig-like domain-containing protein n=1 Tax=Lactiplantibacillus plantarum TaxID=1590 RepID=UPI0006CE7871|nr:Ig-like domain-containing protein [Lactiplantibacillus plantarum]AXQ26876.1 LPXTG cell wall anchor domain-containing protein [Lactiplantibacillus plantarum]KPN85100.1 Soluble lytic murein transglycosylase precursor [Lactiplantibacillus plantarum]KZU69918.1 Soluble lytic murein transglycosylase precursor [Lactiplantibacillus plantarum]
MRKKWRWLLLALTGIFFLMFGPPLVSQARNVIEATGNDVNSAVIKDSKGKIMAHDAQLPEDQEYTVNYNWRIPDNLKIKAGDTMAFQVPENVRIPHDEAFPMKGITAGTIGTFFIAAGAHTGLVTFNQAYQTRPRNRKGFVQLDAFGTVPSHPGNLAPILLEKSAEWADEANPRRINWTIRVLPNNNQLVDPTFVDTLSPNQTYVNGSAVLRDETGNIIPVNTSVNGNQLTFNATGSFTSELALTYQTKTNEPTGDATFENNVTYTDKNGNKGSATATISRPVTEPDVPENPGISEPTDPDEDEEPGVTEPEKPGTTEPEKPGVTEPEKPGTTEPEKPGVTEPEKPGTTEPEKPGVTEPEKPGTTEPEKPGVTEPEKPGTTEPEKPGVTEPEKPGTTEPEKPGVTEPEKPGTTEPEKPGITEPEKPGTVSPEQPSGPKPTNPGTVTPEKPTAVTPAVPNESSPSTPEPSVSGNLSAPANPATNSTNTTATTVPATNPLPASAATAFAGSAPMNKSLPQTNEHSASWSVAIGLALLIGLLGSAFVLTRRTKHRHS